MGSGVGATQESTGWIAEEGHSASEAILATSILLYKGGVKHITQSGTVDVSQIRCLNPFLCPLSVSQY